MPAKFSPLCRPTVHSITPYEPGKPISEVQREFGIQDVVKLASNENPLGPSPMAIVAAREALLEMNRYPDGAGYHLKEKLAVRFGVSSDQLVLGNGSTELVELVTEAFVDPGDEAVIGRYEFFKYRIAMQLMNGVVNWVPMPGLGYDPEAMIAAVTPRTKVLFVANPNNPTGTLMTRDQVAWLMDHVPDHVVVVFDEAYYEYRNPETYPDTMPYIRDGRNVVIFRTFSKAYGIAALRVGFAISTPEIAQTMNTVREVFNVNAIGQFAAMAAMDDYDFLKRGIELNNDGKAVYYRELSRMGLEYVPSDANFILVKTPLPGRKLFQELLKRGVVVRPVDGYDLPEYVRVSIGFSHENEKFFSAIADVLK